MKSLLTIFLLAMVLQAHTQTALPYQVIIDEIMADPSPVVGLPAVEYIELRNTAATAFNLQGWRIGDDNNFAIITSSFLLQPDSFVIVCASASALLLRTYGAVIGVSNFPSLDNDGDALYLLSKEGGSIHALQYNSTWYANPVKNQGGWSLEMIDVQNPCTGSDNWSASSSPAGGTPGRKNAVDALNKDQQPPVLLSAYALDETHIVLSFNEPVDSLQASVPGHYAINNGIGSPVSATAVSPFFSNVIIEVSNPITIDKPYSVTFTAVSDCAGNLVSNYQAVRLGRPVDAAANDIVINEILFNPPTGGTDYLEIYNRSRHIIDIKDCYIANRTAAGVVSTARAISSTHRLLFPGDYLVLTDDISAVTTHYLAKEMDALLLCRPMPSLPDDKGDVLLLNAQGVILDELAYDARWHFKLLNNNQAVALERVDYNRPAQNESNWHSAATSAGYGTPGYQNSQWHMDAQVNAELALSATLFSPDNDGVDDFVTLQYQFPASGYLCNIIVYDAAGRPVRYLTHNALCSQRGYFRWDGLSENSRPLPVGVYIILSEVFNLEGRTKTFKQAVTLARNLH